MDFDCLGRGQQDVVRFSAVMLENRGFESKMKTAIRGKPNKVSHGLRMNELLYRTDRICLPCMEEEYVVI